MLLSKWTWNHPMLFFKIKCDIPCANACDNSDISKLKALSWFISNLLNEKVATPLVHFSMLSKHQHDISYHQKITKIHPWMVFIDFRCHFSEFVYQILSPGSFLAATKQLYKWYFPSVCPSVRLSVCPSVCHTFLTMFPSSYHHEIFRSYYQWQK